MQVNINLMDIVKNLTNGKVEAVVTCEDRKVKEFISILKKRKYL